MFGLWFSIIWGGFSIILLIHMMVAVAEDDPSLVNNYFETYFNEPKHNENSGNNIRNAIKMDSYKWPNGIVPFVFDSSYDEQNKESVLKAMQVFDNETCIKFVPKSAKHVEHIKFSKSAACGSTIGYRANRIQPLEVSFSQFCLNLTGAIQHELFHVLGLLHEQSRPDRDEYITILWENIDPQYFQNFMKATNAMVDTFELPYDYESLMHYPENAFAKRNTNITMILKSDSTQHLGQSDGPTFYDLEKVRRMYKCSMKS